MQHLLKARDLFGYCDGTITLGESASSAQQASFTRESQKAFSILVMAISDPLIYMTFNYLIRIIIT